jgi:type IV pilus assembly protein PilB
MGDAPNPPSTDPGDDTDGRRRRLGELLLAAGVVTDGAIRDALDVAAPGERLGAALVRLGLVGESEVADALATQLRLQRVDLGVDELLDPEVVALLPVADAERHDVLPLRLSTGTLHVAMSDPSDVAALDDVRLTTGVRRVRPVVATTDALRRARRRAYRMPATQDLLWQRSLAAGEVTEAQSAGADATPVVARLEALLGEAVQLQASDLHLEPYEGGARVRLRVDGVLREMERLPSDLHPRVVSRIKLLAELDIAERRRPQDGRAQLVVEGRPLEVRVSVMPTLRGETVALRLLPRAEELLGLDELGFQPGDVEVLTSIMARPQGLVLLTGPTGSGKTTTAYGALATTDGLGRNIRTLEDPVEVRWLGMNQTQIDTRVGVTFATGLRHLLRQDPDVLLVGEVRDHETAQLTVEAASTGHLVVATLHTNDAPSAVARMVDLGADRFLLSSALELVIAQRLVRRNCTRCAAPDTPGPRLLDALGIGPAELEGARLRRGVGCAACDHTGVAGRIAIAELVRVDRALRDALLTGAGEAAILAAARSTGMRSLRQDALERAVTGEISLAEALRVTPDPPWPPELPGGR